MDTPALERVLGEQAAWVQRLARRLAADDHRAADAVQETWLAAMRHPGRLAAAPASAQAWLGRVLRNALRTQRRQTARSARREQDAARSEACPATDEVVVRLAAHRSIVAAVLALGASQREVLVLRFFDDLPPRRIAKRIGVPVATVRTRLARSLAELRDRLQREHRVDPRALGLAALGLRPTAAPVAASALVPALAMHIKSLAVAGLGAAVLAVTAISFWPNSGDDPTGASPAREPVATTVPTSAQVTHPEASAPASRRELATTPTVAPAAPTPAATGIEVRGRVVDVGGQPVPDIALTVARSARTPDSPTPADRLWRADAQGRFHLRMAEAEGYVVSALQPGVEPAFVTVLAGVPGMRRDATSDQALEPVVVVAPRARIAGLVVDPEQRPVEGAVLRLELPDDLRRRLREVLDLSVDCTWLQVTGADGRFDLPQAAALPGSRLTARAPDLDPAAVDLPHAEQADLRVVLTRPSALAEAGLVRGQVVDALGALVRDALVACGANTTRTDALGTFTFEQKEGDVPRRLCALKAGHRPARVDAARAHDGTLLPWPSHVTLQLGAEPMTISGRVVDERGNPLAGVQVWIADPTPFGVVDQGPSQVEGLLAGALTRGELRQLVETGGRDPRDVLENTPNALWSWVRTGTNGRFTVTGLEDRPYRLVAMDRETLLRVESGPVAAGTRDVEIRLDRSRTFPRLAGVVVSRAGLPVPGVRIRCMTDTISLEAGGGRSTMHANGRATATTDEQGRFELANVPRDLVYLRLDGDDVLPEEFGRSVSGGLQALAVRGVEDLSIPVSLRFHLRVELADAGLADSLAVLDGDGDRLPVNVFSGRSRNTTETVGVTEGRTDTLAVPEEARTVLLLRGTEEVRRVSLALEPGRLNVVRI